MGDSKVDYLIPGEEYRPKQPDWEKIKHYVDKRYDSLTLVQF